MIKIYLKAPLFPVVSDGYLDRLSIVNRDELGLLWTFCLDVMKCFEMLSGFLESFRSAMKAIVR